jgi:hypothetical protein
MCFDPVLTWYIISFPYIQSSVASYFNICNVAIVAPTFKNNNHPLNPKKKLNIVLKVVN